MSLNEMSIVMVATEPASASHRTGPIVVAVFALLSALALSFIVVRTIRFAAVVFLHRNLSIPRPPEASFFRTQLGHYAACLILSNIFICIAGLINFSWASRSGLNSESICSAQAVLMQVGIWGICWFTPALGVHNLVLFVLHIRQARWRGLAAVIVGWSIAFVAALAPLQKSNVYDPTESSCSISHPYSMNVFALRALPIILAALVSIVVYSAIFIVLHVRFSMNKPRGADSIDRQSDERFDEYHRFIGAIIWTMFWFPLAFMLLSLPFCITNILIFAGHSIPLALSVFADVCVSMLGFVNVCLLYNTFRVIVPVYRGSRSDNVAAETENTFGNQASGESPVIPQSKSYLQSPTSLLESSCRMGNYTQDSHRPSFSSWASVYSTTGLINAKKVSFNPPHTKAARLSSGITRSAVLSRQHAAARDLPFPVSLAARDAWSGLDQQCLLQSMEAAHIPNKGAKELNFRSKAPPALNLPPLPNLPHPLSSQNVVNKSSTLAARLGIASACGPSRTSTVFSYQKYDQENASVAGIPRIEINTWSPESTSRPPSSVCTDSSSENLGDVLDICSVRPLPRAPERGDNEQNAIDSCPPSPRRMHPGSQRTTMTSVWSQETGYTMTQPPNLENRGTNQQAVVSLQVPGVTTSNRADVGGMMARETRPSGPRVQRPRDSMLR